MTISTTSGAFAAELQTDEETAKRLSDTAAEWLSADIVVSAFESAKHDWSVSFHFACTSDEGGIRDFVREIAGIECANRLQVTTIAAQDWIAASLEGFPPFRRSVLEPAEVPYAILGHA